MSSYKRIAVMSILFLARSCFSQMNVVSVEPGKGKTTLAIRNQSNKEIIAYTLDIDNAFADGTHNLAVHLEDRGPRSKGIAPNVIEHQDLYPDINQKTGEVGKMQATIGTILYADGSVEVFSPRGIEDMKEIAYMRTYQQLAYKKVAEIIKMALNTNVEHPVAFANMLLREVLFNATLAHKDNERERINYGSIAETARYLSIESMAKGQSEREFLEDALQENEVWADDYMRASNFRINYLGVK